MVVGKFKIPIVGQRKYKFDIVNTPSIQYNSKYWKVFEDEMQINRFLELSGEFVNTQIYSQDNNVNNLLDAKEIEENNDVDKQLKKSLQGKT